MCDSGISDVVHQECVYIGNNQFISTLSVKSAAGEHFTTTPLVFLHGVGTGAALWVLNLTCVAAQRTVYAIDMLGFGRSSHVTFSSDPAIAEMEFVESLEAWRQAMHLDSFVLVGHCFGGYVATSYALRYPSHIRHLLIVDPWGFLEQASEASAISSSTGSAAGDRQVPTPLWVKVLALLLEPLNPFALLRLAGSWGMFVHIHYCNTVFCAYFVNFGNNLQHLIVVACHVFLCQVCNRNFMLHKMHSVF